MAAEAGKTKPAQAARDATPAAGQPTFEAALERLEAIVAQLEAGGLGLAESLTAFEEGVRIARQLKIALADAERRVEQLLADGATAPLDGDEEIES